MVLSLLAFIEQVIAKCGTRNLEIHSLRDWGQASSKVKARN